MNFSSAQRREEESLCQTLIKPSQHLQSSTPYLQSGHVPQIKETLSCSNTKNLEALGQM